MGMMFAWATKEYLLWDMTLGQIVLYRNKAIQIKNGANESAPGLVNKSASELRKLREDMKEQIRLAENPTSNPDKELLKAKYGDIE
jgi:hypothetical protein